MTQTESPPPLPLILRALVPFAAAYVLSYTLRTVNAVVAPDLVADFHLTPAELGVLTSAYLLSFALFQLPLGVLLDRYGARRVQSLLILVAAAGIFAFAAAPGFATLVAARAVIGLGFSAGLMASLKSSSEWVPPARRSLSNSMFLAAGGLGVVMATKPTALMVAHWGWRGAFMVLGTLCVVAAGLIFTIVPNRPGEVKTAAPFRAQVDQLIAILRLPLFWRIAPLTGLSTGVSMAIITLWSGPWLRDVLGLPRDGVATHLFLMALAFVAGNLLVGLIADRLQRRGFGTMTIMLGFVLIYMAALALLTAQIKSLALPALMVMAGTGQSAFLAFPWFAAHVGPGLAGRSNATINFVMFVVAFAAQALIGLIIGWFPATATGYAAEGYSWAYGLFLALQTAGLLWYLAAPADMFKDHPS